jgi:hypothetical protein
MKPLKDIPEDEGVIREQIELRVKLHRTLVGTLYPGILEDEIGALRLRLRSLQEHAG